MALFIHFRTYMLFVLVSVLHAQEQNGYCSVENPSPSIEENNDPGIVVTNITTAAGVTVTIDPQSTMNPHWFEINGSQLILKHSVDYETTTVLIVELKCWSGDIEENSLIITLTIINVNDNPPIFKETNITVNVNEDTKVNTIVVPQANVTATDADADVIFYNLTGSPMELEYFNIQGVNNPQILLLKPLDYETINLMEFTLYAMDGNAAHTASAAITIHILQADLRPPWFQPCTLTGGRIVCISHGYTGKVNISENVTEPLILEPGPLYAIDGDRDLDETIIYEIADGNDYNTFSINKYTGNITMNKPANTLQTFMLYIVASQENNPFRYSQTTVEIKVVHRNDHRPDFNTTYMGTVSVDMPISSLVMEAGRPSVPLKIFAADYDFPDGINPDIRYEIQNSSDFRVTADGFLLTTVVLNVASTITLLAIANDTVALQEARTLITVDVLPLATTTIPTTTTTTTPTTPFPAIPGTGTTTSRPSGSSSSLPPGVNGTLPTVPSGSTKPTTPPASTTRNTDITGSTGKPVTGPGGPTHSTSPTSPSIVISTTSASPGPGGPINSTSLTSPSIVTSTTSAFPGPGGPTQSTTPTSPSIAISTTSASPGPGGPINSTSPTSPSTVTSTTSAFPGSGGPTQSTTPTSPSIITITTSASPGSGGPTQSTSPTSPPIVTSTTSASSGPGGPINSTSPSSPSTVTSTTSASPGPGGPTQSTKPTSMSSVTTTTSASPGPGGPINSTSPSSPSTVTSTTSTSPGPGGPTQSTNSTSMSSVTSTTSASPGSGGPTQSTSPTSTSTVTRRTSPSPGPVGSTQSTGSTSTSEVTTGVPRSKYERDMAALGGTLGSLLVITLVLLGLIFYKYYKLKNAPGEDNTKFIEGFTNTDFENDDKPNSDGKADELPEGLEAEDDNPGTPSPLEIAVIGSLASAASEAIKSEEKNEDSEKEVRSILTKDRRNADDDGYKAVWFKEDIDPEAKDDVLLIEDDSDAERNRNKSDGDTNEEEDVDDNDDDRDNGSEDDNGRGSGDVSIIPRRAHLPKTQSTLSESLENTEENVVYL